VLVHDEELFETIKSEFGDRVDVIFVPRLVVTEPQTAKRETYAQAYTIPGIIEAEYARLSEADYSARQAALAQIPSDEIVHEIAVFYEVDPAEENPLRGVSLTTEPVSRKSVRYPDFETLHDDLKGPIYDEPQRKASFESESGRYAWFYHAGNETTGAWTESGTCVVAEISRSSDGTIEVITSLSTLQPPNEIDTTVHYGRHKPPIESLHEFEFDPFDEHPAPKFK
jgi:hypothetical protein